MSAIKTITLTLVLAVLALSESGFSQDAPQYIARKDIKLKNGAVIQAGDLINGVPDGKNVVIDMPGHQVAVSLKDLANMNEAVDVLTNLIRKHPKEAHYYSARANVWAIRNDLAKAIEDASQAIAVSEQKDSMTFVNRGAFYSSARDYDRAVADYIKATHLNPQNYTAYTSLAAAHISRKEYDKAVKVCTSVINVDGKNPAHYVQRGVAHRFLEDWDAAIADFTTALEHNKNDLAALGSRGFVNYLKGDHAAAVKDFDIIVKLKPNDAMAYNNRGYNRQLSGDFKNALVDYDKAVQLLPTYAVAWQNKAWLLATCSDESVRNGQEAVIAAKKACDQRETKVAGDLKALAAAYAEVGDFENAVKYQSNVIDLAALDAEESEKEILQLYRDKKPYRSEAVSEK